MSAKLRLRAISTQPRVTARLPGADDQPLPNSTRRYRRWVETLSRPQFVAHRNRRAARQALRRHEQQAALELLKQRNVEEVERIVAEQKRQRNERLRYVRAQRKLPTWRRACALLDRLEKRFAVPKQQRRRVDKNALKYGTVRPPFVRALLDQLKLRRSHRFVDCGSGSGHLCLLVALSTGADVFGIEIRPELHEIALKIGNEVRKECQAKGWLGVGTYVDSFLVFRCV